MIGKRFVLEEDLGTVNTESTVPDDADRVMWEEGCVHGLEVGKAVQLAGWDGDTVAKGVGHKPDIGLRMEPGYHSKGDMLVVCNFVVEGAEGDAVKMMAPVIALVMELLGVNDIADQPYPPRRLVGQLEKMMV